MRRAAFLACNTPLEAALSSVRAAARMASLAFWVSLDAIASRAFLIAVLTEVRTAAFRSRRFSPTRFRFWADLVFAKFQLREPSFEPGSVKQPLVLRRAGSRQAIRDPRRASLLPALSVDKWAPRERKPAPRRRKAFRRSDQHGRCCIRCCVLPRGDSTILPPDFAQPLWTIRRTAHTASQAFCSVAGSRKALRSSSAFACSQSSSIC